MDAHRAPSRVLAAALGVAAILGGPVVLVATPIVAATLLVERAIGKVLGEGGRDRDNGREAT